jgi:hypothetical protein
MSNINGGGARRNMMSSVDFYRRVPKDLTEVRGNAGPGHFPVEFYVVRVVRSLQNMLLVVALLLFPVLLYLYVNAKPINQQTNNDAIAFFRVLLVSYQLLYSTRVGDNTGRGHVRVCDNGHGGSFLFRDHGVCSYEDCDFDYGGREHGATDTAEL